MTAPQNPNLAANLPPQGPRRVVYLEANRPPTVLDSKYRDGSYYEFNTEWRDKSTTPPNIYKLSNILSKTNAIWLLDTGGAGVVVQFTPSTGSVVFPTSTGNVNVFGVGLTVTGTTNTLTISTPGGGGPIETFTLQAATAPGVNPVAPTALGVVTFSGAAVANHSVPIETRTRALNAMNVEVQYATSAAATDATKSGIAHYNSADFSVDASGFVSLLGGAAISSVNVDGNTAPGTDPVVGDTNGQITVTGGQVAAGTVGANAIRTFSFAANTYTVQIQRSAAAGSSSVNNNGICSFDTTNFSVDSNGWVQLTSSASTDSFSNLGIAYAGGTFTVCSASGAALSSTNAGVVWLQDRAVPGQLKKYLVTANQTFTDGNAGQTATMNFGITNVRADATATSAWTSDFPMYLYAVGDDTQASIAFMISRNPCAVNSPAAASIGKAGAIVNVGQNDFFSLANITVANYDANPCVCVGSFRCQTAINASNNNIAVQTLTTKDGIAQYHDATTFTMPKGVNGSGATNYFQNNGGTLGPTFDNATTTVTYTILRSGEIDFNFELNDATANGTGANTLRPTLPYAPLPSSATSALLFLYGSSASGAKTLGAGNENGGVTYATDFFFTGGTTTFKQNQFAVADEFSLKYWYKAYES